MLKVWGAGVLSYQMGARVSTPCFWVLQAFFDPYGLVLILNFICKDPVSKC